MQDLTLLDNLADSLSILEEVGLLSQENITYMYNHLVVYDDIQINSLEALMELAERVSKIYRAYNTYSKYPSHIIENIDEDTIHPVINVKEYLLKEAEQVSISIDLSSFEELVKKSKFLPKESIILTYIKDIQEIIKDINIDNYQEIINKLFTMANLIKLDNLDIVIERKIISVLNTIRLQLEEIKVPVYSKFQDFLQTELQPSVKVLLARLIE